MTGLQNRWLAARFLPYAISRQMENGSYCSWRYQESGLPSVRDTFWALRIFQNLFSVAPFLDRTRRWLETGLAGTLAGGYMENIFYALFSCCILRLAWPDISNLLERSAEILFKGKPTDRETRGKIRECLLWLYIERKNAVKLDNSRYRLGKFLENCHKKALKNQISLDLPTYGALVEGLSLTKSPMTGSCREFLEQYRDAVTGYRLTPDSRTDSLEALWWGVRLDHRLFGEKPPEPEMGELLESYKTRNGGYGPRPGAIPDLESTGMALDVILWSGTRIDDGR